METKAVTERRSPVPEAERLGVSLYGLDNPLVRDVSGGSGKNPRNEPEMQSRVLAARNERHNAAVRWVQTFGIIFTLLLTLALALWSGHRQSKRESGESMIRFNELINSGKSGLIVKALDEDGNLDRIGSGEDLDGAIDDFLSNYELLAAAYRNGLIDDDMAYDAFSYDLEEALKDAKVRKFLIESRQEEPDFYDGVLELARSFKIDTSQITAAPTINASPKPHASSSPAPHAS